jgi:phospholipase C
MPAGLDQLKHIVVLMMENRSFDHMLGYLKQQDSRIDGVDGTQSNPDTTGQTAPAQPLARYQSQLQPDPGHHFEDVRLQIFGDPPGGARMQGFVKSFYQKQNSVKKSRQIMYCFAPEKVPVITTLARKFAVCNRWFSSLPGPTIPNRAFAHFGTSFGKTDMNLFYLGQKYKTIYERMLDFGRTAKIYYYDQQSATLGMTFLLQQQPKLFATYDQFREDCASGSLPDYSFIEPNYTDHNVGGGTMPAADQHPDHNVLAGEEFIASVYMLIRNNEELWKNTLLLITYDEHGGIYDHVEPPPCTPDEFEDAAVGFKFDRLGVRVPAVLVSPWIPEATVIDRTFDHASIPATVTKHFIGAFADRSPRESTADTFLDVLSLPVPRADYIGFRAGGASATGHGLSVAAGAAGTVLTVPGAAISDARPARPLSQLLREHVDAMREVEATLPPGLQTGMDTADIATEEQAGAYIEKVMSRLHPSGAAARPR